MSDYYQKPDPKFGYSQGDLIQVAPHVLVPSLPLRHVLFGDGSDIMPAEQATEHLIVTKKLATALVLTADCMLDKPNTKFWQICPVVPLAPLSRDDKNSIRKNKRFHLLHLPAGPSVEESFADLSVISTVAKDVVEAATRLDTLSDLARRALYVQYMRYVSRWELNRVNCPVCHEELDLTDELIVRTD